MQIQASNLEAALLELGYQDAVVATAVNGSFVPKSCRQSTALHDGDSLDVLAPMQGG